ncbi:hypothetical protein BC829DRAFT_445899 [Chytridium lagenaria]|nr:hypothetical protein BC829DRAFT_445899 [Chytridium lagenaria]
MHLPQKQVMRIPRQAVGEDRIRSNGRKGTSSIMLALILAMAATPVSAEIQAYYQGCHGKWQFNANFKTPSLRPVFSAIPSQVTVIDCAIRCGTLDDFIFISPSTQDSSKLTCNCVSKSDPNWIENKNVKVQGWSRMWRPGFFWTHYAVYLIANPNPRQANAALSPAAQESSSAAPAPAPAPQPAPAPVQPPPAPPASPLPLPHLPHLPLPPPSSSSFSSLSSSSSSTPATLTTSQTQQQSIPAVDPAPITVPVQAPAPAAQPVQQQETPQQQAPQQQAPQQQPQPQPQPQQQPQPQPQPQQPQQAVQPSPPVAPSPVSSSSPSPSTSPSLSSISPGVAPQGIQPLLSSAQGRLEATLTTATFISNGELSPPLSSTSTTSTPLILPAINVPASESPIPPFLPTFSPPTELQEDDTTFVGNTSTSFGRAIGIGVGIGVLILAIIVAIIYVIIRRRDKGPDRSSWASSHVDDDGKVFSISSFPPPSRLDAVKSFFFGKKTAYKKFETETKKKKEGGRTSQGGSRSTPSSPTTPISPGGGIGKKKTKREFAPLNLGGVSFYNDQEETQPVSSTSPSSFKRGASTASPLSNILNSLNRGQTPTQEEHDSLTRTKRSPSPTDKPACFITQAIQKHHAKKEEMVTGPMNIQIETTTMGWASTLARDSVMSVQSGLSSVESFVEVDLGGDPFEGGGGRKEVMGPMDVGGPGGWSHAKGQR